MKSFWRHGKLGQLAGTTLVGLFTAASAAAFLVAAPPLASAASLNAVTSRNLLYNNPTAAAVPGVFATGVEHVVADSNETQVIDVFNGINAFRATKGLKALKFSVPLSAVSQNWSNTLAATDRFYHNPDYVSGAPEGWGAASEIIAARSDRSGQGLVNQWINSPGHNAVMSTDYYNTIGIGIAFTDMSKPEAPNTYRFGMYGTANLFTYANLPAQTYNHPSDYFSGKPPLSTGPAIRTITPSAPTFSQNDYTLPNVEGVQYLVNGQDALPGTKKAETYRVDITLVPKTGYAFPAGTVTSYSHLYEHLNPNPQPVLVSPAAPEFRHSSATYVIPSVQGAQYQVDGTNKAPGTYPAPAGTNATITVTATPLPGYLFTAGAVSRWETTFGTLDSPITVSPAAPTFDNQAGTYRIPTNPGVNYFVNRVKTGPGVYSGSGSVTVNAVAQPGYAVTGVSVWNFLFTTPPVPDPAPEIPAFVDVPAGTQFSTEIGWMASAVISTGWTESDGSKTFRPLTPVNRDAMAAFMYRLAGKPDFTPPAVSPFTDVPVGAQFYTEITWLAGQNISTGWTEANGSKTFRPLQPVNRDAMAAFMYRLAGKPDFTPPATSPFTDVPAGTQFYKEITWLAGQNISTGWTEGDGSKTYRPLQPVNRDAMAAFMFRFNSKFGSL